MVVSVTDHGADATGAHDSTAAFLAAFTAAGPGQVMIPAGRYQVKNLELPQGIQLKGEPDSTIVVAQESAVGLLIRESGVRLQGLTVLGSAGVPASVRILGPARDIDLAQCTFQGGSVIGIQIHPGTENIVVRGCTFSAAASANTIAIFGGASVKLLDNDINNWAGRAIYVRGSQESSCTDLEISRNHIHDLAQGSPDPRHPIQFVGVIDNRHSRVLVADNVVQGPGRSWTAPAPGTADQISLMQVQDFVVSGNVSRDGGDVGITISNGCIRGEVTANTCEGNDTAGIFIQASDITVTGNTVRNNGQNRQGDRGQARVGIGVRDATNVVLRDNIIGDDQTTPTQIAAFRIRGSSAVTEANNQLEGVPHSVDA